jgi:hypothetical protein
LDWIIRRFSATGFFSPSFGCCHWLLDLTYRCLILLTSIYLITYIVLFAYHLRYLSIA